MKHWAYANGERSAEGVHSSGDRAMMKVKTWGVRCGGGRSVLARATRSLQDGRNRRAATSYRCRGEVEVSM